MADERKQQTREAIEHAWAWWLSQHPESVPEIIERAIRRSFDDWLKQNKAEVLDAIARRSP